MNSEKTAPIRLGDLDESRLKTHPVWTWYEGSLFEAEDAIAPVDLTEDGLAEVSTLIVYSRFRTAGGATLMGTITYDVDSDEVYGVGLLFGEGRVGFNSRLPSLAAADMKRLNAALGNEHSRIFPLAYSIIAPELNISDGSFDITVSSQASETRQTQPRRQKLLRAYGKIR